MSAECTGYSREQIEQYFDHIALPKDQRVFDVSTLSPDQTLKYLTTLQKYQLVAVPFENFAIHYSLHHAVIIDPEYLFKKIVRPNNYRGGYCMENNNFFYTVLHTLGFDVYTASGRVNEGGTHSGMAHQVSLITINGQKYHVDVGFGSYAPTQPTPLIEGDDSMRDQVKPAATRLTTGPLHEFTKSNNKAWQLEYRRTPDSQWSEVYSFTEAECIPADFYIMNYFTSTNPKTFFTRKIVATKFILDQNNEFEGCIILNGDRLKKEIHQKKVETINQFKDEGERVQAIKKYFNITFSAEEIQGVQGLPSALLPPKPTAEDMTSFDPF